LQLSQHRTKKDLSIALQQVLSQLTDPLFEGPSIAANLRCARKQLRELRHQAHMLRQEYLELLVEQANQVNDE